MKEKFLKELEKLDEKILEKLVELSKNEKAKNYLSNPILFATLKGFLKIK